MDDDGMDNQEEKHNGKSVLHDPQRRRVQNHPHREGVKMQTMPKCYDELKNELKRLEVLITTGFTTLDSRIGTLDSRIGELDGRFQRFAKEVRQDLDEMRDVSERTERRLVALETRPPIGITPPRRRYSATVIHSVSAPIRTRTGYYGS